jgi:hypothetical protein
MLWLPYMGGRASHNPDHGSATSSITRLTGGLRSGMMADVSRLTWIERGHGWRAGPYEIELAAPQLWVCTRRRRNGQVTVESTSGSLSALKTRIERLEKRRNGLRTSFAYFAAFLLSMAIVVLAVEAEVSVAPLLVVGFSIVGLWSALKAVDCVIRRSWESINLNYQ